MLLRCGRSVGWVCPNLKSLSTESGSEQMCVFPTSSTSHLERPHLDDAGFDLRYRKVDNARNDPGKNIESVYAEALCLLANSVAHVLSGYNSAYSFSIAIPFCASTMEVLTGVTASWIILAVPGNALLATMI